MRRITFLSTTLFTLCIVLIMLCSEANAQKTANVKKTIEVSNKNFVRWFNNGQIDSLLTLFRDDACLVAKGCGKEFINEYYGSQSSKCKFKEMSTLSLSVGDSIAVEKGRWVVSFNSGEELGGEYLTEWRFSGKKWLIVNDIESNK
ncbi:MAG: hypothetical protein WCO13_06870 [Bacteroidota bacterium]